jgi:hypothetical protein
MSTARPARASRPPATAEAPEAPERAARLGVSAEKYVAPFVLDPTMRFYSPQENVDGLTHPRVRAWLDFVRHDYTPDLPDGRAVLLLVPCTRTKPYALSIDHRRINEALAAAGFVPTGTVEHPQGFPDPSPLVRGKGRSRIVLHRMIVSEPLGLVPYEHMYHWRGQQSPASSYDDPGLFEHRGTSVSPWHPRHSATPDPRSPGRWRWGPEEKAAYVTMHNAMVDVIAAVLDRIGATYRRRVAWVAPGLTHRSFLMSAAEKRADGIPVERRPGGRLDGVNDRTRHVVEVGPTRDELATVAKQRLALPYIEPGVLDGLTDRLQA